MCGERLGTVPNGGGVAMSWADVRIPPRNESDEFVAPMLLGWYEDIGWKAFNIFKNYIFIFFQLTIWMARPLTNNRIVWHTKISIKWLHWSVLICLILWVHLWGRLWWLLRRWSQLIIWSTTDRSLAHWMENIISRVWWNISILNMQINVLSIISRLRDNHLTS